MTRRLEVVKNNGNRKSKFTITHERITVKLMDEDINREEEIVSLGKKIAAQIPLSQISLRGSLGSGGSDKIRLRNKNAVLYVFDTSGKMLKYNKKLYRGGIVNGEIAINNSIDCVWPISWKNRLYTTTKGELPRISSLKGSKSVMGTLDLSSRRAESVSGDIASRIKSLLEDAHQSKIK